MWVSPHPVRVHTPLCACPGRGLSDVVILAPGGCGGFRWAPSAQRLTCGLRGHAARAQMTSVRVLARERELHFRVCGM